MCVCRASAGRNKTKSTWCSAQYPDDESPRKRSENRKIYESKITKTTNEQTNKIDNATTAKITRNRSRTDWGAYVRMSVRFAGRRRRRARVFGCARTHLGQPNRYAAAARTRAIRTREGDTAAVPTQERHPSSTPCAVALASLTTKRIASAGPSRETRSRGGTRFHTARARARSLVTLSRGNGSYTLLYHYFV